MLAFAIDWVPWAVLRLSVPAFYLLFRRDPVIHRRHVVLALVAVLLLEQGEDTHACRIGERAEDLLQLIQERVYLTIGAEVVPLTST